MEQTEIKTFHCEKCGASDFVTRDGKVVCKYCGAVHTVDLSAEKEPVATEPAPESARPAKNPRNKKVFTTKRIAVLSLMVALVVVFSFVPVTFGTVSLALMILPVLILAQAEDFKTTLILGVFLGLINYVAWFTTKAASPLAPVFQNPLVCILPRILIGVVSYWVGVGLRAFVKKVNRKPLNKASVVSVDTAIAAVSTALGVVTNTLFVGAFTLLFFNGQTMKNGTAISVEYILAWFGLNFLIEVVSFSVIVPPIALALKKGKLVSKPLYFIEPAK